MEIEKPDLTFRKKELEHLENVLLKKPHTYGTIKSYFEEILREQNQKEYLLFLTKILEEKLIVFVRHAESGYNEWRKKSVFNLPFTYRNIPENHDPCITETGKRQCEALLQNLNADTNLKQIELVVVSPLTRALMTLSEIWPSKVLGSKPKIVCSDLARERLHTACDIGSEISKVKSKIELKADFSFINKEKWWRWFEDDLKSDTQVGPVEPLPYESDRHFEARCLFLFVWLILRPEKQIMIVSHQNLYKAFFHSGNFWKKSISNASYIIFDKENSRKFLSDNLGRISN